MKKVIEGAVYNTETAKKICERRTKESDHEKGAYVNQLKQLYKTKNANFFFYIRNEFPMYVDVNKDDLNPKFELMDLEEEKIIPVNYDLALQFAGEIISEVPESKRDLGKYFPELINNVADDNKKIQRKVYMSEKAGWYLEMLINESKETNSSFIEKLIVEEYRRQYKQGIMPGDPFLEMEDD